MLELLKKLIVNQTSGEKTAREDLRRQNNTFFNFPGFCYLQFWGWGECLTLYPIKIVWRNYSVVNIVLSVMFLKFQMLIRCQQEMKTI